MKNDTISFRISKELKQKLQQQSKQQNISLSNHIVGLLQTEQQNPCQKSQHRIRLIEIYNAIRKGNPMYALDLLEKEIDKNEK